MKTILIIVTIGILSISGRFYPSEMVHNIKDTGNTQLGIDL